MRPHTYFSLIILIILAVLLAISLQYPFRTGLILWLVLSATILLLAIQIYGEIAGREKGAAELAGSTSVRQYLRAACWVVGILPLVFLGGLLITAAVYSFVYLKFHGERWWFAMIVSLLVTAVIYCSFELGLQLRLYKGLLLGAI